MTSILGGLSAATFLRRHWQKRPLLVRQAFPGFRGPVDKGGMLALAARTDATSRLVIEHPRRRGKRHWERHDGPFGALEPAMLPATHWTVLVHSVESLIPGGWELLREFSFIPAARIDDLMVSYAADGGSVGPHDDLYDVFLLQGAGRRRWQIATGGDRAVDPDAAIKVLRSFVPEEEWLLEPGDMLYLPPGVAHRGVAEGECITYSVGFLAPSHEELVENFLGYLASRVDAGSALYNDPDLKPAEHPLLIRDDMVDRVTSVLRERVRWERPHVEDFLGRYLTRMRGPRMPSPPARPMSVDAFARRLGARRGRLALALPSRGLVRGDTLFLNGEAHRADAATLRLFERLVRERSLPLPLRAPGALLPLLHEWTVAGYLSFG